MSESTNVCQEKLLFVAATHPISSQQVFRWASAGEVDLWSHSREQVPSQLQAERNLPVALPSATKPPGTGPFRLEFWVDENLLLPGAHPEWRQIRRQTEVKVRNLRVFGPAEQGGRA